MGKIRALDPMEALSLALQALRAPLHPTIVANLHEAIWATIRQHAPRCGRCGNSGIAGQALCAELECIVGLLMRHPLLTLGEIRDRGLR